jgi:Ca2+-binding EF-hand superfamily protein
LTSIKAEQDKELTKLMNKDSIETTEKAEHEKEEKDSIAAVHNANITAMKTEQEKELSKLMKKDSLEAAVKDSAATAKKKEEANPFTNPFKKEVLPKKDTAIATKEENPVLEEKAPRLQLPDNFKVYDTDNDGILSYNEILSVIDTFLDKAPDAKEDPKMVKLISSMIDFFFDQ